MTRRLDLYLPAADNERDPMGAGEMFHDRLGAVQLEPPGVTAGYASLNGFRWHELLKRAAPQPKAGFPAIEVNPN